jgi:phosphate:Na+ symporter
MRPAAPIPARPRDQDTTIMLKRTLLPVVLLVLAYGFLVSPELKEIAAGVAIFLFGMIFLEDGFKVFSGGTLQRLLAMATDKLWKALGFGLVSTTLMQSSSLVSVLTISFVTAGLIGLVQGIGIIFGSNLGTTTGAWIIAGFGFKVDIAAYAMPMLVFGVVLVFQKSRALKGVGYVLAGIGFLFLGIYYMKTGFESVGQKIDLSQYAMTGVLGLIVYTLIGIAATVVMQSSHAALTLTIAALAAGQITYENALALAIGSNVGTTITAVLGALSANVAGKQLAGAHMMFNVVTGVAALLLIQPLMALVDQATELLGIAADDYTLKLATFHTVFNLLGILIMVPLIQRMVALLERLFVEKEEVAGVTQPLFIQEAALELPDTALEAVTRETIHLADNVAAALRSVLGLSREDVRSDRDLAELLERPFVPAEIEVAGLYESRVKPLYAAIVEFGSRATANMTPEQAEELRQLLGAARSLVGVMKITNELQPNMTHYLAGDNPVMRDEYNRMRLTIAQLLRAAWAIIQQRVTDMDQIAAILNEQKLRVEQEAVEGSARIGEFIRGGRIDGRMASSLMNDSVFTRKVLELIIDAVQVIFGRYVSLEQDLSLVNEELETVLRDKGADVDRLLGRGGT